MDEVTAIGRARALLQRHGVAKAPVDIVGIAEVEGLETKERELGVGEAGQLFQRAGRSIIVVNKNDPPYRRRFTVAHEIAHRVLDLPSRHGEPLPGDELERIGKRPPEEVLCDLFAAECLVPWILIKDPAQTDEFSIEAIIRLSDQFEASMQCVASRFAQACDRPVAYVLVEQGCVRYTVRSRALRETGIWIGMRMPVPVGSAMHQVRSDHLAAAILELEGSDWSASDAATAFTCHEEAIHAVERDEGIALLSFERLASDTHDRRTEAQDDECELLPPLSGRLTWGKR